MAERVGIQILAEDYSEFKKLMPKELRLGKTYQEWTERRRADDMIATGQVQHVIVRPEEFESYCAEAGRKPNYFMLEALAVKKAMNR